MNLATELNKALRERVTVRENGKLKTISKLEAAVKGLINRAVKGDPRAFQQLLSLSPLVGIEAGGPPSLSETDAAVMTSLMERLRADRADDGKDEG